MKDRAYQARVAALSLMQMTTVANLLRAHGETGHAKGVEAAKDAVIAIIGRELGPDTLAEAMRGCQRRNRRGRRWRTSSTALTLRSLSNNVCLRYRAP